MKRRDFLKAAVALPAVAAVPALAHPAETWMVQTWLALDGSMPLDVFAPVYSGAVAKPWEWLLPNLDQYR